MGLQGEGGRGFLDPPSNEKTASVRFSRQRKAVVYFNISPFKKEVKSVSFEAKVKT
jgi:hypothetical protein